MCGHRRRRSTLTIVNRMSVLAVIPARFASTRFPAKLLADRTGKPLIQHVWEQAHKATMVDRIIVAADDQRIIDAVAGFGGEAVMTRTDHPNGTSRIAEAVSAIEQQASLSPRIVVNVQGDEPDLDPDLIDCAIDLLKADAHADCPVATIASPFAPDEDPANPNIVKVVIDSRCRALYFSRALIPFERDAHISGTGAASLSTRPLKHVGLYVYRREFLPVYVRLAPTPLEQTEKLEQLRVLEHGHRIAVAVREAHFHGIDTPEQYQAFVERHLR